MRNYFFIILCLVVFTSCKPIPTDSAETRDHKMKTPHRTSTPDKTMLSGLNLLSSKTDELGFTHKKYEQLYKGIPIWSSDIIIHINADMENYRTDGTFKEIPDSISTQPIIKANEAADIASKSLTKDGRWDSKSEKLMIYSDKSINSLIWYIELHKSFQRKFVIVNAVNGTVIKTLQGTYT